MYRGCGDGVLGAVRCGPVACALIVLCVTLLAWAGCGRDPVREIPAPGPIPQSWLAGIEGAPTNVLLITLDTTRRDRLGCYGCPLPLTPNLDRLAQRGVLFEDAIAPAPITLPSHATILTGLDPQEHGVRNNGTFALDTARVTLPELLAQRGYATGATLGAFPVEARFGLNQGFADYDDDFPVESRSREWQTIQRRADEVTRRALAWIEAHRAGPFFHWAHYFDPHYPYDPPAEYAKAGPSPYDGEVAFMDAEVGRLIDGLARLGLSRNTWVICVADHGEALGEHGESGHSMLLYGVTQRVPWILVAPEDWQRIDPRRLRGRRISDTVALRDLAPTLANALGLAQPELPASGTSLLPLLAGEGQTAGIAYTETLVPSLEYGWSELRGVRTRQWSYVRAPARELYDLRRDPGETRNLCSQMPRVAARLEEWCERFTQAGSAPLAMQTLDAAALERLRSLGYVGGGAAAAPVESPKDPKAMMGIFDQINVARTALGTQRPEAARSLLAEVLANDPENPEGLRLMGVALLRLGEWTAARDVLERLCRRVPQDVEAHTQRAWACLMAGDTAAAGPTRGSSHSPWSRSPSASGPVSRSPTTCGGG